METLRFDIENRDVSQVSKMHMSLVKYDLEILDLKVLIPIRLGLRLTFNASQLIGIMAKENMMNSALNITPHTSQRLYFSNTTEAHWHLKVVRGLTETASGLDNR